MHGGTARRRTSRSEDVGALEKRLRKSRPPCREHARLRAAGRRRRQPLRRPTPRRSTAKPQATLCSREVSASRPMTCRHWAEGGAGAVDLAPAVVKVARRRAEAVRIPSALSETRSPSWRTRSGRSRPSIYGASDILVESKRRRPSSPERDREAAGHGGLPVCMAKTQYSFTTDPNRDGRALRPRDLRSGRRAALRPAPASWWRSAGTS